MDSPVRVRTKKSFLSGRAFFVKYELEIKKLFKFDSMFFLKYLNGIFTAFSLLQWTPIAPSIRRKICSSMSVIKSINQI